MNISKYLWYLLILTIPFGVRFLISGPAPFSEYASIFLYASDVALILFTLSALPILIGDARGLRSRGSLIGFLAFALISVFVSSHVGLSLVALARLFLLAVAAVGARKLLGDNRVVIATCLLIGFLAFAQAMVAIMQFTAQGAVGLGLISESPISVFDPGTAKITVEGARLIRAYGTMPDPNVLAAFLLVGLCALGYLFLKADKGLYLDAFNQNQSVSVNFRRYLTSGLLYSRIVIAAAMFVVAMGLLFTFSRSGWAATALVMLVLLIMEMRRSLRSAGRFFALLTIMAGALYYFFSPLIIARASLSADEPSVSYRVAYGEIGLEMIGEHPLLGVGIGNQVQAAISDGRYEAHGMTKGWEHQPVHNLYLLVASEIGVIGALSFIAFLAIVMWWLVRQRGSSEASFAFALLLGLLAFGMFDHFLWDLQPGRLMLWLAIAVAIANGQQAINNGTK